MLIVLLLPYIAWNKGMKKIVKKSFAIATVISRSKIMWNVHLVWLQNTGRNMTWDRWRPHMCWARKEQKSLGSSPHLWSWTTGTAPATWRQRSRWGAGCGQTSEPQTGAERWSAGLEPSLRRFRFYFTDSTARHTRKALPNTEVTLCFPTRRLEALQGLGVAQSLEVVNELTCGATSLSHQPQQHAAGAALGLQHLQRAHL